MISNGQRKYACYRKELTSSKYCLIKAAVPATTGVAIEVPWRESSPSFLPFASGILPLLGSHSPTESGSAKARTK